jgi:predicted nucleic acid-binding Zn ribbon protein
MGDAFDIALDAPNDHKHCVVCGNEIKVMCRVGTPVCGENCDKKRKGE